MDKKSKSIVLEEVTVVEVAASVEAVTADIVVAEIAMVDIAADVVVDSEVDVEAAAEAVVVTTAIKRVTSLANAPNKDRTVTNLSPTHGRLQEVDDHRGLSPPNLLRIIPSVLYYAYPLANVFL